MFCHQSLWKAETCSWGFLSTKKNRKLLLCSSSSSSNTVALNSIMSAVITEVVICWGILKQNIEFFSSPRVKCKKGNACNHWMNASGKIQATSLLHFHQKTVNSYVHKPSQDRRVCRVGRVRVKKMHCNVTSYWGSCGHETDVCW